MPNDPGAGIVLVGRCGSRAALMWKIRAANGPVHPVGLAPYLNEGPKVIAPAVADADASRTVVAKGFVIVIAAAFDYVLPRGVKRMSFLCSHVLS